ncbi:MAG: SIS domain-containing protein [Erysipelotrichaceae bacterium]|nr:SIS domain-containing protein [Erysipelotrichaceae bacterium]
MNHNDYNSPLLEQIRNSVKDINTIAENETFELFEKCVPEEVALKAGNIFITGCGDSYCAAIAAKPVFENADTSTKTGMVPGTPTQAFRNIEFSRYFNTYAGWNPLILGRNLLCVISISGSPARVNEAAIRINEHGGTSVAFTCNPEGKLAQNCKYVIPMTLPSYDLAPNVTSYYSSMFSLMMFGFYISRVKKQLSEQQAVACREGLLEYVNSYDEKVMERLSVQAFELAKKWEEDGVDNMDFVGDGPDYATAFFGSAKMVEAFGGLTTNDDSEDWCHINFFIKDSDHIGTFIIANEDSPAFSRELETVKVAASIRKHVAVISDADPSIFPENVEVFSIPKARSVWMHPLMEHIPMDFVAGYIGCWRGRAPFRKNEEPYCEDNDAKRFRNSKIEII